MTHRELVGGCSGRGVRGNFMFRWVGVCHNAPRSHSFPLPRHSNHSVDQASRTISISAPPPTNARGLPGAGNLEMTEEAFFSKMDSELNKIEDFTLAEVTKLRRSIAAVQEELKAANLADKSTVEGIQSKTDRIAGDFLTLEKYVNLNFMGVHKSE